MKKEKYCTDLTQETLKELLHYDSLSGIFTWLERPLSMFNSCKQPEGKCKEWNSRYAGIKAGHKHKNGNNFYIKISITLNKDKRVYGAHRLAFLYADGSLPVEEVDHINGDGVDNRLVNLRKVSHQDNLKNQSISSHNTSGYTGVYWSKQHKKWYSAIMVSGKRIHGGYFNNKAEAITRRKELDIQYNFHENHGREIQSVK